MKNQIRETVKEQLESIYDLRTVRIGRRNNFNADQLNAAAIFTDSEESERITLSPTTYQNTLELKVVYFIKPIGSDLGEDTIDTIVSAADALIIPAVQALAGVFDIVFQSLEIEGEGDEADADYLLATRTYQILTHTAEPTG